MKKAIVVTFSTGAEDTLERFMKAGAQPGSVIVFFLRSDNDEALMHKIKRDRPYMVILNGKLNPMTLERLYEEIGNLIGSADIECRIYSFEESLPWPGVQHVTIEEAVEILGK